MAREWESGTDERWQRVRVGGVGEVPGGENIGEVGREQPQVWVQHVGVCQQDPGKVKSWSTSAGTGASSEHGCLGVLSCGKDTMNIKLSAQTLKDSAGAN